MTRKKLEKNYTKPIVAKGFLFFPRGEEEVCVTSRSRSNSASEYERSVLISSWSDDEDDEDDEDEVVEEEGEDYDESNGTRSKQIKLTFYSRLCRLSSHFIMSLVYLINNTFLFS